jgi:small subunit ribosomal protein S15
MLTKEKITGLFEKHSQTKKASNSGSPESQIALFTARITDLTEHLKTHKKDFSTQQGLLRLVGKRRKLLKYLQETDIERYRAILSQLELRK